MKKSTWIIIAVVVVAVVIMAFIIISVSCYIGCNKKCNCHLEFLGLKICQTWNKCGQDNQLVGGCAGVQNIYWQECCDNWAAENNIVHAQCVGSWTVENNVCKWNCG